MQSLGLDERTWVETPENRAALIASMEAHDPPDISDEEWAEFEAGLKWIGDYTKGDAGEGTIGVVSSAIRRTS